MSVFDILRTLQWIETIIITSQLNLDADFTIYKFLYVRVWYMLHTLQWEWRYWELYKELKPIIWQVNVNQYYFIYRY